VMAQPCRDAGVVHEGMTSVCKQTKVIQD